MKNVAMLADVSFKTVSRVVNGEPGVSRQLEERVIAAIAELEYQPDHGARMLRQTARQSATIGVVHADIANPFMAAVHSAFEAVAASNGYLLLSGTSLEQPERHDELIRAFTGRRVDGLVIIPVGNATDPPSEVLEKEIERGTPVVFIDREPGLDADVVMSDHRGGGELATHHLLDHGHRRIAFLGSREHVHSVVERRAGFEAVMQRAGASPAAVISGLRTPDDSAKAIHDLMNKPAPHRPTAIFTAQNGLTLGAVRALHSLGLQHEIALVGFDHIDSADIVDPGITTVPQNAEDVGRRAGELLFSRILDARMTSMREIVPVILVPRGSGEIPATR
jgi:LacI family transcriptional regulator